MNPKPVTAQVEYSTCGHCMFWRPVEEKETIIGAARAGNCYGVPPTPCPVSMDKSGRVLGQVNCRPVVRETEPACGLFFDIDMVAEIKGRDGAARN